MISFKQYITELFDKPYNAKERENNLRPTDYGGNMGSQTFEAKTKDGDTLGIRFGHFSSKPSNAFPDGNYEITVEFWVRPSGGGRATMGITGKGDAGRIMATVLEITEEVIEEYDPTRLTFHADKFVNPAAKEKVESGRIGLYNAMVKRFAKKNGFSAKLPNPKTVERKGEATYHLNKIGTRVWDKTVTEAVVCGDCFEWANNWNVEHHKGGTHKVVHGLVTGGPNSKTFPHAWIEDKGKVYDTNNHNGVDIKRFYKALSARDTVKYTPTEATRLWFKKGNHGPWDKSFDKWPSSKK